MLGLDCRLDRIQGRRTVFVFGNPIIKTLCATVGFSDVTSANVVGYQQQTSIAGVNSTTPTFVNVDGTDMNAQDMQADETVGTGEAAIQLMDKDGLVGDNYTWYPKASIVGFYWDYPNVTPVVCPEGKTGMWLYRKKMTKTGKAYYQCFEPGTLAPADAVQVYTADANKKITTAGAVPEGDVTATSIAGFNYFGNPFPVTISAQDFQVDETVGTGEAAIQLMDKDGLVGDNYTWYPKASIVGFYWDYPNVTPVVCPENKTGMWLYRKKMTKTGKAYYQCFEPGNLVPGQGVQVYTAAKDVTVTIKCPYNLNASK